MGLPKLSPELSEIAFGSNAWSQIRKEQDMRTLRRGYWKARLAAAATTGIKEDRLHVPQPTLDPAENIPEPEYYSELVIEATDGTETVIGVWSTPERVKKRVKRSVYRFGELIEEVFYPEPFNTRVFTRSAWLSSEGQYESWIESHTDHDETVSDRVVKVAGIELTRSPIPKSPGPGSP